MNNIITYNIQKFDYICSYMVIIFKNHIREWLYMKHEHWEPEISQWNFPPSLNLRVHPISSSRDKRIVGTHVMPGLGGGVKPLDAINICAEIEVVQSDCSIIACKWWVAYHVPASHPRKKSTPTLAGHNSSTQIWHTHSAQFKNPPKSRD